jgi:hypothetical protein
MEKGATVTNAISRPSGEKVGLVAFSDPRIGTASRASSRRDQRDAVTPPTPV